ncbi:MAG: hypothetical protein V5A44_09890 [Haloarculaceae archaeon]
MKRRTLLRAAAGLLAGAGLAGCTGAGGEVPVTAEPPPPGVATEADSQGERAVDTTPAGGSAVGIVDYGGQAATDGTLVVTVTVENESDREQVRLVRATVGIDDVRTVGERFVRLPPRESRTVSIQFDVGYETWAATGSLAPEVVRATPATPIPTDRETPTPGDDTRSATGTTTDSSTGTTSDTATDSATVTKSGTGTE